MRKKVKTGSEMMYTIPEAEMYLNSENNVGKRKRLDMK